MTKRLFLFEVLALSVHVSACQIDTRTCSPVSQQDYDRMADQECLSVSLLSWPDDEIELISHHPNSTVILPTDTQPRVVNLTGFRTVIGGATESMHVYDVMSGSVSSPDIDILLRARQPDDCSGSGRNFSLGLHPASRVRISAPDRPDCFDLRVGNFISGTWQGVDVQVSPEAAPTNTLTIDAGPFISLPQLQEFGLSARRIEVVNADDAPLVEYSNWLVSSSFGGELWLCDGIEAGVCQTRVLPTTD